MIKGVYFDLDGILFSRGIDSFVHHFSSLYNIPSHTVEAVFKRSKEAHEYKQGLLPAFRFFEHASKVFGINIPEGEYVEELASCFLLNSRALDLLYKIKAAGLKTILCANIFEDLLLYLDHKYRILELFDVKIFSFNIHQLKPNKKMYEALLEASHLEAGEILYVDDDKKACIAAETLGFISHCSDDITLIENILLDEGYTL